jgi:hypothetical protein
MGTEDEVTWNDVDDLREDIAAAREVIVESHLRIAELLSDSRLRQDMVRLDPWDAMHPDDVARYARISESGLSADALDDDTCALLPPDLRSLELLARLSPDQLEALRRRVHLADKCPCEIEREVEAIQGTGDDFCDICADCQVRREAGRVNAAVLRALEDLPDGPAQERLLDAVKEILAGFCTAAGTEEKE